MMDRRSFNRLALGAPLLGSGILAAGSASAQSVDLASLMAPGPLPDKTLGDPQAPVTVVEYASLTCGHCASFHTRTYPALKERYVEAGQVFFVMRDFPLDAVAAAAAMLARCMPDDSYFTFIDLLFQQQRNWAFTDKPVDARTRWPNRAE
ncbi:MAG: thioredoxin domain-containing protein [Pseudomonadota bacterium]